MPIYEYECLKCGARFDRLQRFGDPAPESCPNGHHQIHRLLSEPAIIFKGSGFYVTDNGRSSRATSSRNGHKPKSTESGSSAGPNEETSP